jgi:glucose-6-phosphate isomerase
MLNDSATTAGDYLLGFSLGTRKALQERFRVSITLTLHDDKPFNVGAIIAIFERIVGFMASFLNINAYHQPGVEAGKLAAEDIVRIKVKVLEILRSARRVPLSSSELAERVGHGGSDQIVDSVCNYLAANGRFGIRKARFCGDAEDRYFSI